MQTSCLHSTRPVCATVGRSSVSRQTAQGPFWRSCLKHGDDNRRQRQLTVPLAVVPAVWAMLPPCMLPPAPPEKSSNDLPISLYSSTTCNRHPQLSKVMC